MQTISKYYRFNFCDGLEALSAVNYKTSFPSHFHSTFNLSLVYNGTFNTHLNDRSIKSPCGSLLITNPGEIHANPRDKDTTVSFFTFYISKDFMEYCNGNESVFFLQKTIDDPFIFSAFHELSVHLCQNKGINIEKELSKVLRCLIINHATVTQNPADKKPAIFQQFLLEAGFEKFSLDDAAKGFGINKFKFIRLFKYQTGLTPNNYFIYRRIERSKQMLAEGRDLLSIAIELGFYDAAHYCNHFKKFTGISPLAFLAGR